MTSRLLAWPIFALVVVLELSCSSAPQLTPQPPVTESLPYSRLASIPSIAVGTVVANTTVGNPRQVAWNRGEPLQLYCVTVNIENVLRGSVPQGRTSIYYFADYGVKAGPPRLGMANTGGTWHISDHEIFFLWRDGGVLRTTCDCLHGCAVPVRTGAHRDYRPNPAEPMPHVLVDILLTQGEGCSPEQMANAIDRAAPEAYGWDPEYTIAKIERLAATGTAAIQTHARAQLDDLRLAWANRRRPA